MKSSEITFLFGSGISFPSGIPSVKHITNSLINGNWRKTSFESYCPDDEHRNLVAQKFAKHIVEETKKIRSESIFSHYHDLEVTYEDIFSVLEQIRQNGGGLENLATSIFLERIYKTAEKKVWRGQKEAPNGGDFDTACIQTEKLIKWGVKSLIEKDGLAPKRENIVGFDLFDNIEHCGEISKVNIFTLNHDLLIETYLQDSVDTFFKPITDKISILDTSFSNNGKKFNLYKLHGSVDWVSAKSISESVFYTLKSNMFPMELYLKLRSLGYDNIDIDPLVLSGSMVKEYRYCFGPFYDLFPQFHLKLNSTKTLFISGYGWGDFGINRRLLHWLQYILGTKLILLHDGEMPPFFKNHFLNDRFEDKVVIIPKWFQNCNIEDIVSNL